MAEQVGKKKVNSKAKGGGFELVVAKKLSVALAPLNFVKTQGSGARVGGKNFETIGKMFGEDALKLFVGDVVPVNERDANITFKYSVETKFYKTPDSFTALASGNANVYKWFEESVNDSAKIGKIPMLVFKWNRTDTFVIVEKSEGKMNPVTFQVEQLPIQPLFELIRGRHLQVFSLDELLKHVGFWCE